jgi:hypothetical protein
MLDGTLTLTGGWAIFAIACMIYFIIDMLVKFYKWIDEPFKVRRDIEKELDKTREDKKA